MTSFAYFFAVFAFFIVSFGLGFYIIFKGYGNNFEYGKNPTRNETNYFSYPYLTLIKTPAMMIGELVSTSKACGCKSVESF